MRSPGRPSVARREDRQRFWAAIARGLSSEDAASEVGASRPVGTRWFREGGGMPTVTQAPLSGRYLSFADREEIAILNARRARRPADCSTARPFTVDDLARTAPQRRDAWRPPRLPGDERTVARRLAHQTPEAVEARNERRAPSLRRGSPRRRDHEAGRQWPARPGLSLDRTAPRTEKGPALGEVMEPGADRRTGS